MNGLHRHTGQFLSGVEHVHQSIADILTTPIGTRVMRRDYGSRLMDLVDAPINAATRSEIYVATAEALEKWEPRFKLHRVQVTQTQNGRLTLDLLGEYLPEKIPITLEGLQL